MPAPKTCPRCSAPLPADAPEGLCPKCLVQAGFQSQAGPASTGTATNVGRFEPPTPGALAPLFPQLSEIGLLGQGGMGAVYKARQVGLDRLVAVKILPPEVGRDPAFAERFAREARAMARLSHPHIVTVHDFGQAGGLYYFIMEFIDGMNLRQASQTQRLAPEAALAIVPQICDALQYAHDQGVVHRDIKPENILLDQQGRVKIADFGLSKLVHDAAPNVPLTGSHQVMGTLRYMAPEQLEGARSVDHRADIYSLGVVFYELLTGQLPLGRFDLPSQKVQVDVRIDEVVLRALAQEPAKRYQHASEVRSDIDAVRRAGPPARTAAAPQMLLVIGSMIMVSALVILAGGVLFVLAFVLTPPGGEGFWGYMGGAFGCVLGGLGSLLGCLNSYRQMMGGEDLMRARRWTWLDRAIAAMGLLGTALLTAGVAMFIAAGARTPTSHSLMLLGGLLAVQGGLFTLVRWPFRTASDEPPPVAAR